jgi:protein-S-isoprenylcysteine O-methyltransferase Ste14
VTGRKAVHMNHLARKTILGFAKLVVGLGILLFVPAWTLKFWQAWLYLLVFTVSAALITAYLWVKDSKLLERRVKAGPGAENESRQKFIQTLAALAFAALLVLPSLDHRFSWSKVPFLGVMAGDLLVASGFYIIFVVFKENTFASATVEMAPQQKVISTGPYAIVRHPMYSGALVMLFGTPLALGSWWGLLPFAAITYIIRWRLLQEEKFLTQNLPGYGDYCHKVKHRLARSIW